ncbi:MAG: hypothetical protein ACYCOU_04140 [Sulfobacillus sp.]
MGKLCRAGAADELEVPVFFAGRRELRPQLTIPAQQNRARGMGHEAPSLDRPLYPWNDVGHETERHAARLLAQFSSGGHGHLA